MLAQLVRWLKPSPLVEPSHRVYIALVTQSRQPFFYSLHDVPDTLDGRFDMIVLHLFLVNERLRAEETYDCTEIAQYVTDAFIADMDRCLREMGVGDTGVAKRVKRMADALNGRQTAYREGLVNRDQLIAALKRNLYGTVTPKDESIKWMADYMSEASALLSAQSIDAFLSGALLWPQRQPMR